MPSEDGTPTYEELQTQLQESQKELQDKENDIAFLRTDEGKEWYRKNMLGEEEPPSKEPVVKPQEKKEETKDNVIDPNEITQNAVAQALKAQEQRQGINARISQAGATVEAIAKHLHETSYPGVSEEDIIKQIYKDPGIAEFAVNSYSVAQEKKRLASVEDFADTTPVNSVPTDKLHPIEREMAAVGGLKEEDVLAAGPDSVITY